MWRRSPVVVAIVVAALLVGPASPVTAHGRPQIIAVTIGDRACTVAPAQVGFGNTHFQVVNKGRLRHGFAFAGHKTGWLRPGGRSLIDLDFLRPGSYPYFCTTRGRTSMQGRIRIGNRATSTGDAEVVLTRVGEFSMATVVVGLPDDASRLVVGQQDGAVFMLVDGERRERPFLDLRGDIRVVGENGFLGLAFAPDYVRSGLLYVFYNDNAGDLRLVEYQRSRSEPEAVDPETRRELLSISKVATGHNGGQLAFGPDGYLYVNVGEGAGEPAGLTGQRLDNLFASILRIDPRTQPSGAPYGIPPDNPFVGVPAARPEIWAYGLRNPWRSFIDAELGLMYIADVGASAQEEVNVVPLAVKGANFGWPCYEGLEPFSTDFDVECPDAVPPVYSYTTDRTHCAIIGGVVSRDPRLPALEGHYLFADLCSGEVSKLLYGQVLRNSVVTGLGIGVENPLSFGTDALGRIYISSAAGPLWRLDAKGRS